MKEYKVIAQGGLNLADRLTTIMNEYAQNGWIVKAVTSRDDVPKIYVVFERDK